MIVPDVFCLVLTLPFGMGNFLVRIYLVVMISMFSTAGSFRVRSVMIFNVIFFIVVIVLLFLLFKFFRLFLFLYLFLD